MNAPTEFNPKGQGADYRFRTMGKEDQFFFDGAEDCDYQQAWNKYVPHAWSNVIQYFTNNGTGNTLTCQLTKAPVYYNTCWLGGYFKGMKPNAAAGVTSCSYVNGVMYRALTDMRVVCGQNTIARTNGLTAWFLHEAYDKIDTYSRYAGFFHTREELIQDSRKGGWKYLHLAGLFFSDPEHPERSLMSGGVGWHPMPLTAQMAPMEQLWMNYNRIDSNLGVNAIPVEVNTGSFLSDTSASFLLITQLVFGTQDEEDSLMNEGAECLTKEYYNQTQKIIPKCTTDLKVAIDLDFKGPVTEMMFTFRSAEDIKSGNWIRDCRPDGEPWVSNAMIAIGDTYMEDGLPIGFNIGPKRCEAFRTEDLRHTVIFSAENDAHSKQPNGHMNTLNMSKLQLIVNVPAHDVDIVVDGRAAIYNGVFAFGGLITPVWALQAN